MKNNYINIDHSIINKLYDDWKILNSDEIHPHSSFYASLGIQYMGKMRSSVMGSRVMVRIDDHQKYFLAKIRYGI